jgi:putative transposase
MNNKEIHKRKSIRLKEYDYSLPGYYFVTIHTYNKEHLFGNILNGKMELNEFGEIVNNCIMQLNQHFPNSSIDYFCIMPNHLHIILINGCRGQACLTPTEPSEIYKANSLSTIIGSVKSAITKQINLVRKSLGSPVWQRNYYEHIIRNEKELFEIRKYIEQNALNWSMDEYNPKSILR